MQALYVHDSHKLMILQFEKHRCSSQTLDVSTQSVVLSDSHDIILSYTTNCDFIALPYSTICFLKSLLYSFSSF